MFQYSDLGQRDLPAILALPATRIATRSVSRFAVVRKHVGEGHHRYRFVAPRQCAAAVLLAASVLDVGIMGGRHALAETTQSSATVQRVDLRASMLHAGSTGADVERILGRPEAITGLGGLDTGGEALLYDIQNIRTRVVLRNDRVTTLALDLVYVDPNVLPPRARVIKATMLRDGVTGLLGFPDADERWTDAGRDIERMTFARPGEPEFSVYLADGLVVDVKPGRAKPQGLVSMLLPAGAPDAAVMSELAIGLTPAQAAPLLGTLESETHFALKGQPVEYRIYESKNGAGLTTVTFIGGVLTAFALWPSDEL